MVFSFYVHLTKMFWIPLVTSTCATRSVVLRPWSKTALYQDLVYLAITSARPEKVYPLAQQDLVERLVRYAHVTIDTRLSKAHTKKYAHATRAAQKNDQDHGSGRVSNVMLTSVTDAARNVHLNLNL
jgi:hypothetical protein